MENDFKISSNIKNWIIIGVVAFVTFILVFAITNKLVNGKKKDTPTTPTFEIEKYDAYKVGDEITLKDGSNWHVIYDSKDTSEYLTLLSDEDVNDSSVLYGNVNSFLKGTYKSELVKGLGCQSTDIQEIRLFAYIDLADISKASSSEFQPNTELSKFNFPEWVYSKSTVTDTVYQSEEKNIPVMICTGDTKGIEDTDVATGTEEPVNTEDESLAPEESVSKFCLGDSTIPLPVRPVLVISKKILKTTSESVDTNTTNSTNVVDNTSSNTAE